MPSRLWKPRPWPEEFIPHMPFGKQATFLMLPNREAFYGGAAGPGKSDALLMGALQYVEQPDYAAILFRRTFTDLSLPGALMDRAQEWLRGTRARWHDQSKTWHFPSGATVSFGYLETEMDKFRYQGAEFQFIGFDELTQFTESQYTYLFSRLRRGNSSGVPLRMRAASNPGGLGHAWVKERFVDPGAPGVRPFIRALLKDNPYVDQAAYIENLKQLTPVEMAQLLNGDWIMIEGTVFRRNWFKSEDYYPEEIPLIRFWDLAATDPVMGKDPDWTAGALIGTDRDGGVHVVDVRRMRGNPSDVEKFIRGTAEEDGPEVDIYMEQEPGASGKSLIDQYRRRVLQGYGVYTLQAAQRGSKIANASPLAGMAGSGNVYLVKGKWHRQFLDEAEGFPEGQHDDMVDAVASGFKVCVGSAFKAKYEKRRVTAGTMQYMDARTPDCDNCKQPVYFPAGMASIVCQRCGTIMRRDVPEAVLA